MSLFSKIMLSTIAILAVGLSVCGYFLIFQSFDNSVKREAGKSFEEYRLLKYTFQSAILNESRSRQISDEALYQFALKTIGLLPDNMSIAIYTADGQRIYSDLPKEYGFYDATALKNGESGYVIKQVAEKSILMLDGLFEQSGTKIYLYTASDITEVINELEAQKKAFFTVYVALLASGVLVTFFLSLLITKPIKKLTGVSRYIADGNFGNRVDLKSCDEVGQLGKSFNRMADVVEEKIAALKQEAKKREEFISNFSHELKTPLTAVIGYADMLYSKEYDREGQKKAAYYILSEGLRLEALSKKLMELIVLDKQDFILEQMKAEEFFSDIQETMEPEIRKKGVRLETQAEGCIVYAECDLLKTLMMNLIDNAMKADAKHVILLGKLMAGEYIVCVQDDGRGIPETELPHITEAFYMVDKSRSRKQNGAGLGLSICSRIARLHHTDLRFASELGKGTKVCFSLPVYREAEHE